jgi:two-component system, NarL family, nitrate/nitrite response regulator NarL
MRAPRPRWHIEGMPLECVIIDDNESFLKVARATLERQGVAVVGVAANGTEALRQARELSPDVALVDISLGAESGFDVGRDIVQYVGSVILISSHDEDDYYAEAIAASPAVGFLSKARLSAEAIRQLVT